MSDSGKGEVVPADAAGIARAAELLRAGKLVAVPTETVYGLAARADSPAAVAGIYRAKERPDFNPLIVHIDSVAMAERLAVFGERAHELAERFWPGPLTLVLPLRADASIAPGVCAGLSTIALRMPAHPAMRALIAETGLPLAAPSANRSGAVSPTAAAHVIASLGSAVDLVLDAGVCERGLESTIVGLRQDGGWQLLRPGPIAVEQLTGILGQPHDPKRGTIEAPGQLPSHYSPGKPVRLEATSGDADEFLLGFGAIAGDYNLSANGDLAEAASRLYAGLHLAAAAAQPRVAVAPIPEQGIGAAIRDRLTRAATSVD